MYLSPMTKSGFRVWGHSREHVSVRDVKEGSEPRKKAIDLMDNQTMAPSEALLRNSEPTVCWNSMAKFSSEK
jgi:hypothetical protein